MPQSSVIADALAHLDLGPARSFRNLTMFPLLAPGERTADYLTLDEAMTQERVRIAEVGSAGIVAELFVRNTGPSNVLLIDGEELVGAKQNRVLNLTILVPSLSDLVIPVSCVESGRWHRVSHHFAASPRAQFAEGRAAKMRTVTASMEREGSRRSDQGDVWARIDAKASRLGTESETSAMAAVFERHAASVDDFVGALPPLPNQAGAVFAIYGVIVGLELFDAPGTWRKLAPKLVRSYALDAIDRAGGTASASAGDVRAFLTALAEAEASEFAATGLGTDLRISSGALTGAALVVEGRAVHLSAFVTQG